MQLSYPESLPIVGYKDDILQALQANQVIIVQGETGSGKTTQLPKFCLEFLGESGGIIGCTQPRRIAATSVAERVKEEIPHLRKKVGHKIRFHDHTSKDTKIKFMTDGVLLAETQSDRDLKQYSILIIDEAHERSLNIDFVLGYLRQLLQRRADLKIIISSATIDTEAFSVHFSMAPVIEVEGKTYPVEVRYSPLPQSDEQTSSYIDHCVDVTTQLSRNSPHGDILVFLPTEKDIRLCCEALSQKLEDKMILPLFGRLQSGDQNRIFTSFGKQKIVVSTNVAETSVTVPGIKFVVDAGLARISQYNVRSKTTSLPVAKISQASCDQRKGRCGRVGPGICIRLYSEDDYQQRDRFTLPEIKRSNLSNVILQMSALGLGSPVDFPFIDPPPARAVRDGYKLLSELGAIRQNSSLTKYGKTMASLPIDPCISRIIIEANRRNCLTEISIIGSALAIQSPHVRPADKEKEADQAHKAFLHKSSDFFSLLHLWNHLHDEGEKRLSWSKIKKICKTSFLSFQRIREWFDLHEQMCRILLSKNTFSFNDTPASYEDVHLSLSSGFLRNIARREKGKQYRGAGNLDVMVFPGSHQFSTSGNWIIAASFLETSRLYALTVANIQPEWLEKTGKHLCSYSYSNPGYNRKTGQVQADEKVTLFGLTIIEKRRANYGKNPRHRHEARAIFIQMALIEGNLHGVYTFLKHNLKLVKKWHEMEQKTRQNNILVSDEKLFSFYDEILPDEVYNRVTLNTFLKNNPKGANRLRMSEALVVEKKPEQDLLFNFPDTLQIGSLSFPLTYIFEPGHINDGMTVHIPLPLCQSLRESDFEWLVPGLLYEKLMYLLKSLPKSTRKKLVPINQCVDLILDEIDNRSGSLFGAIEQTVFKTKKVQIKKSEWDLDLPQHLHPNFFIVDNSGKVVASGRDLRLLQQNITGKREQSHTLQPSKIDSLRIKKSKEQVYTSWDFGEVQQDILLYDKNDQVKGILYPFLKAAIDRGGVLIDYTDNLEMASEYNKSGMTFLYRLKFSQHYKSIKKYCSSALTAPSSLLFFSDSGHSKNELNEQILQYIMSSIFDCSSGRIHPENEFNMHVESVKKHGFYKLAQEIADTVFLAVRKYGETVQTIKKYQELNKKSRSYSKDLFEELISHLNEILPKTFLLSHSPEDIKQSIRLLDSLQIRVERAHHNPAKDAEKQRSLLPYMKKLRSLVDDNKDQATTCFDSVKAFKRGVDEYRIALFTPELRGKGKISPKILENLWSEVQRSC